MPNHSKTRQHLKIKHTSTIIIPHMFGIRAPIVVWYLDPLSKMTDKCTNTGLLVWFSGHGLAYGPFSNFCHLVQNNKNRFKPVFYLILFVSFDESIFRIRFRVFFGWNPQTCKFTKQVNRSR